MGYPYYHQEDAWRPSLMRRAQRWLDEGKSVALIGGPGMGKRWLAHRLEVGEGRLSLIDIEDYDRVPDGHQRVPLGNLPKHQVKERYNAEAFLESAGHPLLLRAYLLDTLDDTRAKLREALAGFRAANPEAWALYERMAAAQTTATDLYRQLKADVPELKPKLDLLCCAGLVARSIHGDRAGVVATPL